MSDQLSRDLVSLKIEREPSKPRSRGLQRLLVPLVVVLGLVAIAPRVKRTFENSFFKRALETTTVMQVSPIQARVDLTATGYVIPQVVAKVGSKVSGRIVKVHLKEGDTVRTGQVLFELDPVDQQSEWASAQARVVAAIAKAEAARAQAAELELQLVRNKRLAELGAVAPAAAEDLEARVTALRRQAAAEEAEIRVSRAEANVTARQLKNFSITSPIEGTAVSKPAQIGEVVSPSEPLVELVDFASLLVEVDVPEARLSKIKPNGPCEVTLEASPERPLKGVVADFTPRMNRAKATATVKVRLVEQGERIWPDMSARVSFLSAEVDDQVRKQPAKKMIAQSAVVERNGEKGLWIVRDQTVAFQTVRLGATIGANVEVVAGAEPGTPVVLSPPGDLVDGQKIKEKNAAN
jgi:RND family efflux transporter MFP subunit